MSDVNDQKITDLRQYYREYYQKNKARILEKQRLWREQNRANSKPMGALMRKREKIKKAHDKLTKRSTEFKESFKENNL